MKKTLLTLTLISILSGCNNDSNTNSNNAQKIVSDPNTPYKEYSVNDTKVADLVEENILKSEADKYGFDLKTSSAHMISFKKIGTYGSGEIKVIAFLNSKGIENAQDKGYININRVVTYTCRFEYSYKTEKYVWNSDYPYASTSTLF
ncbi:MULTISPECIES: lipoprotein [Cetobacterium]|uniref:Lipoprotein n=1 Tax=Candidatus Cetobacterium colombiensis TaxID=3073100 RepID=A0ABU4WA63_9FUSO|nr:lipoprotein [Candidatus Cetobacterium colombiensis]MDX8335589.1 lipoprotein [Candidatus Cetobacterium colombiensis]